MKKLGILVAVLLLLAAAAVAWIYLGIRQPFRGYSASEQFVDIPPGLGTKGIGERLVAAGVVRDTLTFRVAMRLEGRAARLKAGEYRFTDPMTPFDVIDKLRRGDVFVISTTFPEGLNVFEMAKIFESKGFGTAQSFVDAARSSEGYLFPDTYPLSRHTDAKKLVHLMRETFERELTPDIRAAAQTRGLSIPQLVTLASIVEKETGNASERPLVASVYENRLRLGMALQCDPTVIYALELTGHYDGNIRRDDLMIDSPYNTYRYPGLPPGPIASPGRASLEAVVHPADSDYLYFVSRNDGTHVFAKTLAEHTKNVQHFQVEYFRAGRTGKAGKAP
ncbi:MAG TPA: endolytic transglycosylase MltG [Vicinamibacterales bacterium]|nr:endolytic transglycosylase MltG [Vicinamibacterales bacterium]